MARVSDIIEDFIKDLIKKAENDMIEIGRNELAQYFQCSPSQINYVLTTRFSSEKGYYVESRRGGGGYIKITKVNINNDKYIENMICNSIGDTITKAKAYSIVDSFLEKKFITKRESQLIRTALSDRVLNDVAYAKNRIRSKMLKDILLVLLK